jgi:hypothetical protein
MMGSDNEYPPQVLVKVNDDDTDIYQLNIKNTLRDHIILPEFAGNYMTTSKSCAILIRYNVTHHDNPHSR